MIYDLLFQREDPLYDAAILALTGIQNIIRMDCKVGDMPINVKNVFQRLSKDKNSPAVLWIDENQYIAYYPPYSAPCPTVDNNSKAKVEVLKGVIYCRETYKMYVQGDKFEITAENRYIPYTREKECYLRVIVDY